VVQKGKDIILIIERTWRVYLVGIMSTKFTRIRASIFMEEQVLDDE